MPTDHYAAAERELAAAINDSDLVDDLPADEANSYEGRRARHRAGVSLKLAEIHAMLALVDAYSAGMPRQVPAAEVTRRLRGRTIIVAPTIQRAHHWCRDNGIPPHSRGVIVLTTPDSVRGLSITADDHVRILDELDGRVAEQLAVAYLAGGRDAAELNGR